jgi:hypothetical protein
MRTDIFLRELFVIMEGSVRIGAGSRGGSQPEAQLRIALAHLALPPLETGAGLASSSKGQGLCPAPQESAPVIAGGASLSQMRLSRTLPPIDAKDAATDFGLFVRSRGPRIAPVSTQPMVATRDTITVKISPSQKYYDQNPYLHSK